MEEKFWFNKKSSSGLIDIAMWKKNNKKTKTKTKKKKPQTFERITQY